MSLRTHLYTDLLKQAGYGYLLGLWAADTAAIIGYENDVSAILASDGSFQTTHTDASELVGGSVQDWKTLWWVYTPDSPRKFATVLPTTDTVDMKKLARYLGVHELELSCGLRMSEQLPALHTPGTAGPWTTKSDLSIDSILVDKTAFEKALEYQHTSWAFPGIATSKVYIPDVKQTLTGLSEYTDVPVYFADIRKQ